MKILVCGSGPNLPGQLKDVDLNRFDKVVRINEWQPILGYDNRCDVWAFYPPDYHKMGDLREYFKTPEIWVTHAKAAYLAAFLLKRPQDRVFPQSENERLRKEIGDPTCPRTGILTLRMAQLVADKVYTAGFDFYQSDEQYYFQNPNVHNVFIFGNTRVHPLPSQEKAWFDNQVQKKKLINLEEIKA